MWCNFAAFSRHPFRRDDNDEPSKRLIRTAAYKYYHQTEGLTKKSTWQVSGSSGVCGFSRQQSMSVTKEPKETTNRQSSQNEMTRQASHQPSLSLDQKWGSRSSLIDLTAVDMKASLHAQIKSHPLRLGSVVDSELDEAVIAKMRSPSLKRAKQIGNKLPTHSEQIEESYQEDFLAEDDSDEFNVTGGSDMDFSDGAIEDSSKSPRPLPPAPSAPPPPAEHPPRPTPKIYWTLSEPFNRAQRELYINEMLIRLYYTLELSKNKIELVSTWPQVTRFIQSSTPCTVHAKSILGLSWKL